MACCSWTGPACASRHPSLPLCTEYAQVTRMLGNGRLEAFCFDGVNRLCHIRGKLRKRVWIGVVRRHSCHAWHSASSLFPRVAPLLPCPQGDIVLLGLREFQDQKADIILKYDGGARTAHVGQGRARVHLWCTSVCFSLRRLWFASRRRGAQSEVVQRASGDR